MGTEALLELAINAALQAGEEILRIYGAGFSVEKKSDNTPVTEADRSSGRIIESVLKASQIPVISEEESLADYSERKSWKRVWIVDPLDGTKEFVKRNGEFAVNIALVEDCKPVIGVIYAPVLKELYFGSRDRGSYKVLQAEPSQKPGSLIASAIRMPSHTLPKTHTLVASRSHLSRDINAYLSQLEHVYGSVGMINTGSSIKQCWVADGRAHEYPRFGTTMEWDTAAGQCLLEEAGGSLIGFETQLPLVYNKVNMQNPFFVARAKV